LKPAPEFLPLPNLIAFLLPKYINMMLYEVERFISLSEARGLVKI
jgi:hypothetical protein